MANMSSFFRDRTFLRLSIAGFIFFVIACVLPTRDSFLMTVNGQRRTITRQNDPTIF
jgi:hypothetical protein